MPAHARALLFPFFAKKGKEAALLLLIMILTGCVDKGRCLLSHEQLQLQPQYIFDAKGGIKSVYYMPIFIDVCDQWEFPEGRPQ